MQKSRRHLPGFTLIELLVVIAIISILAGLGFAGINGAMKSARKAEVRAMANQIKLAVTAYYADYAVWPTNSGRTDKNFLEMMTATSTNLNRRGIRYLEPASKFTNATGVVTPAKFYRGGNQSNFFLVVDTNYDGRIEVLDATTGSKTNISASVGVYVKDPDQTTGWITSY